MNELRSIILDFNFELNLKCVCLRRDNITKMGSEVSIGLFIGSLDVKLKT